MKMYEYQRNNSMYLFLIYLTEFPKGNYFAQKEINEIESLLILVSSKWLNISHAVKHLSRSDF